jgi:hypothetical protein
LPIASMKIRQRRDASNRRSIIRRIAIQETIDEDEIEDGIAPCFDGAIRR